MKVHDALAAALVEVGFDTMFGVMGDSNLHMLPAYQHRGGRYVPAAHESGAVAMADAYHRVTGRIAVAAVTHGPGVTNSITSLTEATRTHSQVLVVTGDPQFDPLHPQRLDLTAAAVVAGAGYERVYKPETLVRDLNRALQRIVAEQRPVLLNVPRDFYEVEVDGQRAPVMPSEGTRIAVDADALEGALGAIVNAQRPVIIAGRGAAVSGAREELVGLADRLSALLGNSVQGKGMFTGDPRNLGDVGYSGHPIAVQAVTEADCLIVVGAGLNSSTSYFGELTKNKRIVHIDSNAAIIGDYIPVHEAVVADAKLAVAAMNAALDDNGVVVAQTEWSKKYVELLSARDPLSEFKDLSTETTVDPRAAAIRLGELIGNQNVIVSDLGRFDNATWPYLEVSAPRDFTLMASFQSIGLGLPGAIGASVGRPDMRTFALVGDGGLMQSINELATAAAQQLPLTIVVWNDGAYGAEYFRLPEADVTYATSKWPDFATVARAMGVPAMTVRAVRDLDGLPELVASSTGPVLVDIILDPRVNTMPF